MSMPQITCFDNKQCSVYLHHKAIKAGQAVEVSTAGLHGISQQKLAERADILRCKLGLVRTV